MVGGSTGGNVYYIVDSEKSVNDATRDLEDAVKAQGFGVLHVYDLKETLKSKGFDLPAECRILEVCNPQQATTVLARDMNLNMALPCRISVYQHDGRTKIGTIRPSRLLGLLSHSAELRGVARNVERAIETMIDDAARSPGHAAARRKLLERSDALRADILRELRKYDDDRYGTLADNIADSAELAVADLLVDVDLAEVDRDVAELRDVEAALARLADGTFGTCTDCGAAIALERLERVPEAARCVPCQQRAENRDRREHHRTL
jgi:uncharacterized protein (DUF302 family)